MNKIGLNLLPWRDVQTQWLLKRLLFTIGGYILTTGIMLLVFTQYHDNLRQKISEKRTALEQVQGRLLSTNQQIIQLQTHAYTETLPSPLTTTQITAIFQLLQKLPLQQGELSELQLDADRLDLIGFATSQEEFNQLHEFLRQQSPFSAIKLTQFKPSAQQIFFQFTLPFQQQGEGL